MKVPTEDWFFLFGLILVALLVLWHFDATTVAALVGAHKGMSVADGKIRDRIGDAASV